MRNIILFAIKHSKNIVICLFVAAVVLYVQILHRKLNDKNSQIEQLNVDKAHAAIPGNTISYNVLGDSSIDASSSAATVKPSTYKKKLSDSQLLKQLGVNPKAVDVQADMGSRISDSVTLTSISHPDIYTYKDHWFNCRFCLSDSSFTYSVTDSVVMVVNRLYRHHFLFWHWGTEGYQVHVVNYNPHSRLLYNQYIRIDK